MPNLYTQWLPTGILGLAAALTMAGASGCATPQTAGNTAPTARPSSGSPHGHTDWIYRHMGHRHAQPVFGGDPVIPACSTCEREAEALKREHS